MFTILFFLVRIKILAEVVSTVVSERFKDLDSIFVSYVTKFRGERLIV